jgi:hypothetical protein
MDLPLPLAAWQLRQTPPDVVATIDDLLDHHTHTEIANILNTRGLASGENRPFHKLIVARIVRNYQLRTREQRLRATGMLTLNEMATTLGVATSTVKAWRDTGLVHGQRYNDHGQMLYHPPGPNPQPATKDTQRSPNAYQRKDPNPPQRSNEVQYETNGFALGARGGIFTTSTPSAANTASNVAVNLPSRSRTRNRNDPARSPRSPTRLRACCVVHAPVGLAAHPEDAHPGEIAPPSPPGRTGAAG